MPSSVSNSIIVDIVRISAGGDQINGECGSAMIEMEESDSMRIRSSVRYDLFVQLVSAELIITGSLDVDVSFRCSKCAAFFDLRISEPRFEASFEVDEKMESVDLTGSVREAILLAFPSYPICRKDCMGLCPGCGIDLNEGKCECAAPTDDRWGGLDMLDIK